MADRLQELLQPHLDRETSLKEQLGHLENQLGRVRFELGGVQQRIQGIREAAQAFAPSADVAKRKRQTVTRNRGMSGHWQKIMQLIDLMHTHFAYADLAAAATASGVALSNEALRSQMSDYKARGWVQSAGIGAFSLTDAGRRAAGIQTDIDDKNKAPDVGASGAFGRVAELEDRPKTSEQHPFRKGENVGSSPTPPSSRPEPPPWDSDDDIPF